MEIDYQLKIL